MTEWNYDMSIAPAGSYEETPYTYKGKGRTLKQFQPHRVLVAHLTGNVGITWKLQDGRWNGYTKDEEPLAWMPLPEHPGGS